MTALPNTRDALETTWHSAGRHARRMASHSRSAAEDIGQEIRELLAELDETLSDATQSDAATLREQMRKRIDAARARLDGAHDTLRARAASAVADASTYVRENPWEAVAVFGGLALVAGWIVARNR
ncbi:MAG TPA: DUF883 family protein [Trinickia sp.]|jgi:ElaB/YqjD/DUF883 family membrane-anchored ribosome-binding protein|uniref:DUF883 family protein n=1 Tax=Trinickia sp. TaxID=2571163 RepID=UPI002D0A0BA5|nr:DUF883 family protein [Trinickia sp.]HTI16997.1 DUF883 family protein [Trinickia sp.]